MERNANYALVGAVAILIVVGLILNLVPIGGTRRTYY